MRRALVSALRAVHLIQAADALAAWAAAAQARTRNAAYRQANPDRDFPDPRQVFAVAGHADLASFDQSGAVHATAIAALIQRAGVLAPTRILEWGCGPARILSHLGRAFTDASLFGCDPDARAIAYARNALPKIQFARIAPRPPTPYPAHHFDAVYGVSILTHLSEFAARAWLDELARVVSQTGCVILTTHGEAAAERLSPQQRAAFDASGYVEVGGAPNGSRAYAAYVNQTAGRRLFSGAFEQVEFIPAGEAPFGQDVWLLRGPKRALTPPPPARTS